MRIIGFIGLFFIIVFSPLPAMANGSKQNDNRENNSTENDNIIEKGQQKAAAIAVLDRFYETAGAADFAGFIELFSKDSFFYGTDASEIWPYEEFAPSIENNFDTGTGWDFELKDRRLTVSKDGKTAWFAELAHFNNTDYLVRPSGILRRENGQWKIAQIIMGIPIPNALYIPVLQGMQASDLGAEVEKKKINTVLDNLHEYAATANGDAYFALFTQTATYIGTDVSERWSMAQFKAYAKPYFDAGRGWVYTPRSRHITLSPMKNIAWFEEILDSKNYGTSRGSGTLIRTPKGWKISQYALTFPIPNPLAKEMTTRIKTFENQHTTPAE